MATYSEVGGRLSPRKKNAALCVLAVLQSSLAYPTFQKKIPNGDGVRNWPGVGHFSSTGGGPRNPFGEDFAAAGFTWTKELCQKDSDGDGLQNGLELGDPDCAWKEGDLPKFTVGISHPGVKEGDMAGEVIDSCEDYMLPTGSAPINLTLSNYKVPPDSTYACTFLEFPSDAVRWVSRMEVINTQPDVLHHILFHLCSTKPEGIGTGQFACSGMASVSCPKIMFVWAVGQAPFCLGPGLGMPIGEEGSVHVLMQVHFDNPHGLDIIDNSGISFMASTQQPPTEAGYMLIGDVGPVFWALGRDKGLPLDLLDGEGLQIPPVKDYDVNIDCPAACPAEHMKIANVSDLTIFAAAPHAHALGRELRLERVPAETHPGEADRTAETIAEDLHFDYELQRLTALAKPIKFYPGDRLRINCRFDASSKKVVTNIGETTSQEMCLFGFLYYPLIRPMSFCIPKTWRARPHGQPTTAFCGGTDSLTFSNAFDGSFLNYNLERATVQDFTGFGACQFTDSSDAVPTVLKLVSVGSKCKDVASGASQCRAECANEIQKLFATGCVAMFGTYNLLDERIWRMFLNIIPSEHEGLIPTLKGTIQVLQQATFRCGICTDDRECSGDSTCSCVDSSLPIEHPSFGEYMSSSCMCRSSNGQLVKPAKINGTSLLRGTWGRLCAPTNYQALSQWDEVYEFGANGTYKHTVNLFQGPDCIGKYAAWDSVSVGKFQMVDDAAAPQAQFGHTLVVSFNRSTKVHNDKATDMPVELGETKENLHILLTVDSVGTPITMQLLTERGNDAPGFVLGPVFTTTTTTTILMPEGDEFVAHATTSRFRLITLVVIWAVKSFCLQEVEPRR